MAIVKFLIIVVSSDPCSTSPPTPQQVDELLICSHKLICIIIMLSKKNVSGYCRFKKTVVRILITTSPFFILTLNNIQTTQWSRLVFKKLSVAQPAKKSSTSDGTQRFIAIFARPSQWVLLWASWIQPTFSYPIFLTSVLKWSYHLCLDKANGLFPSFSY